MQEPITDDDLRKILPRAIPDPNPIAGGELVLKMEADSLRDAVSALRAALGTVHLSAITSVPADQGVTLLYHFWLGRGVTLRVQCNGAAPQVPSLTPILPAANWYEREAHDMTGVRFEGHPDLSPLLLSSSREGPPPLMQGVDTSE